MTRPPSIIASRVLIVEDEPNLRAAMVTGLSRLPGIEAYGAASVSEALVDVATKAPAMVISDLDLPDRSGIEILGELAARGLRPQVVFISAYTGAYRAQVPPHDLFEKPMSLESLRALVLQRLAFPTTPSPFGVADYLQLASMGHHSVLLEVGGDLNGTIVVVDGEVWAAADSHGEGLEAFRRLVLAKHASVFCHTLPENPGPRVLQGSAESLLLECARLADEERGDFPAAYEAPSALTFEDWFDRGVEALLAKAYSEALAAFRQAAALRPTDAKAELNVHRLELLLDPKISGDR